MKRLICLLLIINMVFPAGVFAFGEEVIFTSSFEEGMEGWQYYNSDAFLNTKITSSCATDGEVSMYILDPGEDFATGVMTELISIEEGETYSVSCDSYILEGSVKVFFRFYDKNSVRLANPSKGSKVGKWENVVLTGTAPEGAAFCQVALCSIGAYSGKAYFDNVKIVKGVPTSYEITGGTYPSGEEVMKDEFEITLPKKESCELLYSESFENGYSEWTQHNPKLSANVILKNDKAYHEKKSVYFIDDDEVYAPGLKSKLFDIEEGEMYTAAAYFYNIDNKSVKLWLKYLASDQKTSVGSKSVLPSEDRIWVDTACSYAAPEGARYCQILIAGISSTLGEAYVDYVRLYKGVYTKEVTEPQYLPPTQATPVDAKLVAPVNNKLSYTPYNSQGDIVGDYSYAGFFGGDYELPVSENLEITETLSPSGKDDTNMIQEAIDRATRTDGKINIVKLKAGTYFISPKSIYLKSGVLLSGEGQGPTGTILYAFFPVQYQAIKITGKEPAIVGEKAYITDDYVNAGSKTVHISDEDIKSFKVGDRIAIYHNSTEAWAKAIGMHGVINVYDNDTTWKPGSVNMITERVITSISGNEITFDFGVFVPYMKELVPSYMVKIDDSGKVMNAGIENLRIESYYNGDKTDEEHATTAISISNAKNIFIRDVTGKHFYFSVVSSGKRASCVTVRNCSSIEPISKIAGARRYSFAASTSAQQILYTGCHSHDGRHDFETSYSVTGPISYVDNVVDSGNTGSETHGTWSTGVLYDNLYHVRHNTKGYIAFANRGMMGTQLSQGWTSASAVAWNCLASTILVHKPPLTYQNFSVGMWGQYTDESTATLKENNINSNKRSYRTGESIEHTEENFETDENTSFVGDAYKEARYTPVNPRSLYKAQLSERYTGVISNARPNAPIIVYPMADKETKINNVKISGIFEKGAQKVTVYIDNQPYNAILDEKTNEFEYTIELPEGTHKIYATQTIDGVEGNKNADRFIVIGKTGENHDYLQSIYSPDKVRMLINDPRLSYDEVMDPPQIADVKAEKTDGGYTFVINLSGGSNYKAKAEVIVALYGDKNTFIGYAVLDTDTLKEKDEIFVYTKQEAKKARVMIWSGIKSLHPLGNSYDYNL